MAFDWLTEPLSDDAPCGPDLEKSDDPVFIEYYFEAEGRLPERYFTPGMRVGREGQEGSDDVLFDPASVDHKKERAAIEALLKRSRDLRLLTLLARWEVLAGRLGGLADALVATAELLEAYPDDAHPQIGDSSGDRRGALDNLATSVTMTIPLQYVPLTGQTDITLRRYLAATGAVTPRSGEEDASVGDILDAMKADSFTPQLSQTMSDLGRAADAFVRIKAAGQSHPEKPMSLNFDDVLAVITQLQDLIRQARPELDVDKVEQPVDDEGGAGTDPPEDADIGEIPPIATATQVDEIDGQPAARVTLLAIESYLKLREPSSAALLLVTQARLLIGKPLVEALETLLPEESRRAVIDFGPATGFALNMDRLRQLSGETGSVSVPDVPDPAPPELSSRADVAGYIRAVESYFRNHEPTSPVPTLLVRARHYLDKDFDAIVAELIPMPRNEEN